MQPLRGVEPISKKMSMEKIEANTPVATSADQIAENVARLKSVFPEMFTEGPDGFSVNVDVLKALVGDKTVTDADEKYGLSWHGKRRARQLALTPSTGTLRPCPEESVDWDTTQNLFIEGDNLEVLKLLQKSFGKRVKAIYIDPPYNTGRNIVYPNDYTDGVQAYLELTGQVEGGRTLTTNPETNGRFHSNWLSMIYPRLIAAKPLLRPDGVLFCTIDENEHSTLAVLMKEVFPEGAYEHAHVSIVHNPRGQQGTNISYVHESAIIVYPADQNKYLADVAKEKVDSRNLRDSGTESDRTDARTCFYPFLVRKNKIIGIGEVPPEDFHPASCNVERPDGVVEVWPMTDDGDEKKWRYSRDSVAQILPKLEPKGGRNSVQIIFHKDAGTMRSVWQAPKYDSSEYGTKLVERLVGQAGFTFPKSLWAVRDALALMTTDDPDAIVLDFFAGSGTSGHALWELTKDLGGRRRSILVQLPEPLDPSNKEQKAAVKFCDSIGKPRTIAELTKERLRRAAAQMKAENPDWKADTGFRVFKLATSNIKAWNPQMQDLQATLLDHEEHLVEGRSVIDLLYESLLKLGIDLSAPIEKRSIGGKDAYAVNGGALIACLDLSIGRDEVEPLAEGLLKWRHELPSDAATACLFRDSAFVDDVAKTNMVALLAQGGIKNVRSL